MEAEGGRQWADDALSWACTMGRLSDLDWRGGWVVFSLIGIHWYELRRMGRRGCMDLCK